MWKPLSARRVTGASQSQPQAEVRERASPPISPDPQVLVWPLESPRTPGAPRSSNQALEASPEHRDRASLGGSHPPMSLPARRCQEGDSTVWDLREDEGRASCLVNTCLRGVVAGSWLCSGVGAGHGGAWSGLTPHPARCVRSPGFSSDEVPGTLGCVPWDQRWHLQRSEEGLHGSLWS